MSAVGPAGAAPAKSNKLWLIISREYKVAVLKKSFWIGLFAGPIFFGLLFAAPYLLFNRQPERQKALAVVDASGRVTERLTANLSDRKLKSGDPEFLIESLAADADSSRQFQALNQRVLDKKLYGYLFIGASLDTGSAYHFYVKNPGDVMNIERVDDALDKAMVGLRLAEKNLPITQEQLESVTKSVRLETFKVSEGGKTEKKGFSTTYFTTFAFVFFLYMTILIYGITGLRSILEEKSSRIIEVLLSSVTPLQLMQGKMLGLFLVGLTQVGVYALLGTIMSILGLSSGAGVFLKQVSSALSPMMMGYFVIFFLLGFFLFSSMFVAIGSMVNSEQDAQSMQQPVIMALVIPMAMTFLFVTQPDSLLTRILSLIPFFTPMIMFMRISVLTPPVWEIALSIVLTLATTVGVTWLSARIFRVGILMYGKRPTLPEILQWIKS